MKLRKLTSVILAVFMTLLPVVSVAHAELVETIVRSAPLERSSSVLDGMVRVYLSSLGSPSSLDITVAGSYSVEGNASMTLSSGQTVSISFNTSTGNITMTVNGMSYAMGQEMVLRRHQTSGESGLRIAQARRPSNLYPGDLQLVARSAGSGYKLYPIVHVYVEYYLYGVVPYEMSSSWPIEALKAQSVAARTYTLNRMNGRSSYIYDLVDTSSDQVYNGHAGTVTNATTAVDATKGIVIMNDGKLSGTYYTASNGGQTESVKNAWGSSGYAYLGVKDDPFDVMNPSSNKRTRTIYRDFDYADQNSTLKTLLTSAVQEQLGSGASIVEITGVTPHTPKYASPSRLYTMLDFTVTAQVGSTLQEITLPFSIFDELETPLGLSINSTKNELWSVSADGENFVLTVARYGHGIGMSQRGAQQMANMGYTYDQILGFYYDGCSRVQYTFTHTILPSIGSGDGTIVATEAPATIVPALDTQARVQLIGVGDSLPIRYTAANNGKVLLTIPNGSAVTVLSYGSTWTMISYGMINGYVPTESLSFTGTPPTSTSQSATNITQWGVVTGSTSLNLREGPGYGYDVQGSLPGGAVLAILSNSDSWVQVQYGQQVGYCALDYLTLYASYPESVSISGSSAMVSLPGELGSAPLRSTASTSGTILLYVDHGTQVTVYSNDGTWCRVGVSGVEGYMLASALDFTATGMQATVPPLTEEEMYAIVNSTASTLNLRQGPGTSYDVIAEIPKGTQIVVTSYGDDWCAVRWGSLTGYVMTSYLSFDVDAPTATPTPTPAVTDVPAGSAAITVTDADLFTSASAASDVLLMLPSGETVTVMEYGETWSKISYSGLNGYVLTACLQLYADMGTPTPATPTPTPTPTPSATPSPTPEATYTPVNSTGRIILDADQRAEANTASTILQVIPAGETVTITSTSTAWYQVTWQDVSGWVLATQVQIIATGTPTPSPTITPAVTEQITNAPDSDRDGLIAWIVTTVTSVNLRAEPSDDADILTQIPGGDQLTVWKEGDTWSLVTWGSQEGYVFTQYLTYTEPDEALGIRYINTDVDPLSMRDKPTTTGSIILTRIPRGEKVTLLKELGDWSYVQYGQVQGYCASHYLSRSKPEEYAADDTRLLDSTLTEVTGLTAVTTTAEDSSLYLKEWCSTHAPTVSEVPSGVTVTVRQKGNIWCLISYEGEDGYCLTNQLQLNESAN